jgi:hypothetical protein
MMKNPGCVFLKLHPENNHNVQIKGHIQKLKLCVEIGPE